VRDSSEFETWLRSKKGLNERSAKDVASRLRRANKIIKFSLEEKETRIFLKLAENAEFQRLSATIRSQLRRSVRLAKEMLGV
jgi:hypothetical protein